MRIENIKLVNFRNFSEEEVNFFFGVNIFSGKNAQGKTNLLESIYYASAGFSPRVGKDIELLRFDTQDAHILANFTSEQRGSFEVKIGIAQSGASSVRKKLSVNKAERSFSDIAGLVPTVLFWISDLDIVREAPAVRRKFLDVELSMMSRTYNWTLKQYNKALDQRNKLLKQMFASENFSAPLLESFDAQLIEYGSKLIEIRNKFIADLNADIFAVYQGITMSDEYLRLEYVPNVPLFIEQKELYKQKLVERHELDYQRGVTSVGPHRDDFSVTVNGRDIRTFGSQGEGRSVALALRIAEFKMLERVFKETPILLLDDVMSELDENRRQGLLGYLSDMAQVIVTTTNIDAFGVRNVKSVSHFNVENGQINIG